MRNLLLALIFLGAVGYMGVILYERVASSEFFSEGLLGKTFSYPDTIKVENKDGSTIQITLIGRSLTHIQFSREDGRKFVYPIDSLSEKSQALVMKYPNNGIQDISSYLASGDMELKDVYVQQLEEEIRKINEKIERLSRKAASTQSQVEKRTIEREIEDLREEIAEIEDEIAERQ